MASVAGMDLQDIAFDEIDYSQYETGGGKGFTVPPKGKYFIQNGIITDESFGQTNQDPPKRTVFPGPKTESGKQAILALKLEDGSNYEIRVFPFSTAKYSFRMGSQAIDWLRACGIDAQPKTDAEFRALAKMASGRTFQVGIDWEAFVGKGDEHNIKGMDNFPVDEQDPKKRQPWIDHPYEEGKRVWARPVIKFFVDAVKK